MVQRAHVPACEKHFDGLWDKFYHIYYPVHYLDIKAVLLSLLPLENTQLIQKKGERMNDFLKQNGEMLRIVQKKAGIDPEKVQKTVFSYLQIAKDNQLNYNELSQAVSQTKDLAAQSLSKVLISTLPDIASEPENGPDERHRFSNPGAKGDPGTPGEPSPVIRADIKLDGESIHKAVQRGRRKAEARDSVDRGGKDEK